jgi:hypothetical protein
MSAVAGHLSRLDATHSIAEVSVDATGGPKTAFLATLLAVIAAGWRPMVIEPVPGETIPAVRSLTLEADLTPWLVRERQFSSLAHLAAPRSARRRVWQHLARCQALDWAGIRDADAGEDEIAAARRDHPYLVVPPALTPPPEAGKPATREGWTYYRSMLQSSFLARVDADPASALHLARPLIETWVRELAHQDRAGAESPLVRALDDNQAVNPLHSLVNGTRTLPAGHIRTFLENPALQRLHSLGNDASHGKYPPAGWQEGVGSVLAAWSDSLSPRVAAAPPATGDVLIVIAVGEGRQRERDRSWPSRAQLAAQVEAIAAELTIRLTSPRRCHLVMTHTAQVHDQAEMLRSLAIERLFASVTSVVVPPDGADQATELVEGALVGAAGHERCAEVMVVAGPGTKAMNLAILLACARWAADRARPLTLMSMRELKQPLAPSSVLDRAGQSVLPRLGQDRIVGDVLVSALRRLELATAARVIQLGSARWAGLAAQVANLETLIYGHPPRKSDSEHWRDQAKRWFPARAACLARVATLDAWRAVYSTCAAAEAAWYAGRRVRSVWYDQRKGRRRGYELWRLRNQSPFGHEPWREAPDPAFVDRLIADVILEVRDNSNAADFEPPDALTGRLDILLTQVDEIAGHPALR